MDSLPTFWTEQDDALLDELRSDDDAREASSSVASSSTYGESLFPLAFNPEAFDGGYAFPADSGQHALGPDAHDPGYASASGTIYGANHAGTGYTAPPTQGYGFSGAPYASPYPIGPQGYMPGLEMPPVNQGVSLGAPPVNDPVFAAPPMLPPAPAAYTEPMISNPRSSARPYHGPQAVRSPTKKPKFRTAGGGYTWSNMTPKQMEAREKQKARKLRGPMVESAGIRKQAIRRALVRPAV